MRRVRIGAVVAVVAGVVGIATGLGEGDRPRTYAALIASWLFFAGLTAAALAFRALFTVLGARWARPLVHLASAVLGFVPVAMIVLVAIVLGASFAPWLHAEPTAWTSVPVLAGRELAATALLFGCGALLRSGDRTRAVIYLVVFAIVVSFWAFDFVLGVDGVFESTLIGPFVFVSAFVGALGLVTLIAMWRGALADPERRDATKLVLALAIFWAYLFWSQYLTIWYGNLPEEVAFALRRTQEGWGAVVLVVIGAVFAVPFLALLHPAGRRAPGVLAVLLGLQLVGLWLVCHLLIVPALTPSDAPALAVRDVVVALGMLGAFVLAVAARAQSIVTNPVAEIANSGEARARVLVEGSKVS